MSTSMQVTVYTTVLNERDNIALLLDSLLNQSRMPDEIIVVDGGSTDGTVDTVKEYTSKGHPIRLIESPGANVATGRNIGIDNATFDVVASTDAGCTLHSHWLENLRKTFTEDTDVVSGVFLPDAKNTFEECVADLLHPGMETLPEDWSQPSHRSIAFRKKVWEEIGPIPEGLYRSEDTWFNYEAKRRGFKFKIARDAIVYWRPRKNLREVYRNSYLWVKSDIENDVQAEMIEHESRLKLLKVTWRVLALLVLLVCGLLVSWLAAVLLAPFVLKEMITLYVRDRSLRKTVYKNLINLTFTVAYIAGYLTASWNLSMKRKRGSRD